MKSLTSSTSLSLNFLFMVVVGSPPGAAHASACSGQSHHRRPAISTLHCPHCWHAPGTAGDASALPERGRYAGE